MVTQVKSAYHFFWPNILLFTLAGIWSPYYYDKESSFRKRAYKWYSRVVLLLCVLYIVQSIVECIRLFDVLSIDDKSEIYSYTVQLMVGLVKIFFLGRNEEKMRKMFLEIEEKPFQRNDDVTFQLKLRQRMKTNIKIMCMFWIPIYTTVAIKLYTAAMDSQENKKEFQRICFGQNMTIGSETYLFNPSMIDCTSYPKLVMPWYTWFPFSTDTSPGFYVGVCYQLTILTIFASYIFNFDIYISSWMMYISFQFEMMEDDLGQVRERSELKVMKEYGSTDELLVTQEMVQGIRKIINLHNDILKLIEHTQESLSVILLVQYFWISVLICMLMIQMSVHHPTSTPFFSAAGYLFVAVLQIFVVFYHSNEVKLHSLKIRAAAFYSGWHLSGQYSSMLKSYIMFMIRCTNKEIRVLAGGIFVVDMVAFLKVMKASYSYFALVTSSNKN